MSNPLQGRATTRLVAKQRQLEANPLPTPPVQPSGRPQRASNRVPLSDEHVTPRNHARSKSRPPPPPLEQVDHDRDDDADSDDTADESSDESEGSEYSESEDVPAPIQQAPQPRTTRKPRQSLGEVVAETKTCHDAVKTLKDVNELIDNSPLSNLDRGYKLGKIKRYSTALIEDIENINARKKANSKANVDSLSFSRLKETHLARLNITAMPTSKKGGDDIKSQLVKAGLFAHAQSYWVHRNSDSCMGIITLFKKKWHNFSKKPEAKSRILADDLIFHATECLRQAAYLTLSFLEFTISTSKSPVFVDWGDFVTYLTGSVDYALVCSRGPLAEIAGEKPDEIEKKIQEKADKISQESSLEGFMNNTHYEGFKFKYGIGIRIFELKKKVPLVKKLTEKTPGASLEKHKPQVLGESLAIMTKTRDKILPWCLTNGLDWIFGLVEEHRTTSNRQGYCLRTISLMPTAIDDKQLFEIFMSLVLWVAEDPELIVDFLKAK